MKSTHSCATVHLCLFMLQVFTSSALFVLRDSKRPTNGARRFNYRKPMPMKRLPKYLMKLYDRQDKTLIGDVNMIRGVFPLKTFRTKRALKLVFHRANFESNELWTKDELRLFMNKGKSSLTSSTKPYLLKIFDLYSKKLISVHKLPTENFGWETINIVGWREIGPKRIRFAKVGLKLAVFHGKKKLRIENTPFRKTKAQREPYLVVFSQEKKYDKITKGRDQKRYERPRNRENGGYLPFPKYALRGREED